MYLNRSTLSKYWFMHNQLLIFILDLTQISWLFPSHSCSISQMFVLAFKYFAPFFPAIINRNGQNWFQRRRLKRLFVCLWWWFAAVLVFINSLCYVLYLISFLPTWTLKKRFFLMSLMNKRYIFEALWSDLLSWRITSLVSASVVTTCWWTRRD